MKPVSLAQHVSSAVNAAVLYISLYFYVFIFYQTILDLNN